MDARDAYRSAKTLIDSKGDWAEDHARARIYVLMEADDQAGVAARRRIKAAMKELRRMAPAQGRRRTDATVQREQTCTER